jgi:hypothetical protein
MWVYPEVGSRLAQTKRNPGSSGVDFAHAQALSAVGQMGSGSGSGSLDILVLNGVENAFVLLVHPLKVGFSGGCGVFCRAQSRSWNHPFTQK